MGAMVGPGYHRSDEWGRERDGYSESQRTAYAPAPSVGCKEPFKWVRVEVFIGSLTAASGIGWSAYIASSNIGNLDAVWQTRGPLEICAIGVLIWLHAKWRGAVAVR